MKCPHLMSWFVSSCRVEKKPYVPSIFELEEYCNTKEHEKCPLYRKVESEKHGALPLR